MLFCENSVGYCLCWENAVQKEEIQCPIPGCEYFETIPRTNRYWILVGPFACGCAYLIANSTIKWNLFVAGTHQEDHAERRGSRKGGSSRSNHNLYPFPNAIHHKANSKQNSFAKKFTNYISRLCLVVDYLLFQFFKTNKSQITNFP